MNQRFPIQTHSSGLTLGVDIGGSKLLAGVVDDRGRVRARVRRNTPDRSDAPAVLESVVFEVVNELRAVFDVLAVGVGAAGFVDSHGWVRFAPHLCWRDEPLQTALTLRLGIPVLVDNDANAAARAEMRFGAGRGQSHALCVTLGTGIGGALVVDGQVLRGAQGFAGEFGHMPMVRNGRQCECGQTGCWEQYCSGMALVKAARKHGGASAVTGPEITSAAVAGEGWALAAFDTVGTWLGVGLAGLVSAFDPEIVVVGGGLSDAGDFLLDPTRRAFTERLPGVGHRHKPPIVRAALGADAGFIGAADLARASVDDDTNDRG